MLSKSQDPQVDLQVDPQVDPQVDKDKPLDQEVATEPHSDAISKPSEKIVHQKIKELQKKVLLSNKKNPVK